MIEGLAHPLVALLPGAPDELSDPIEGIPIAVSSGGIGDNSGSHYIKPVFHALRGDPGGETPPDIPPTFL